MPRTIYLMIVVPSDLPIARYAVRAFLRHNPTDDLCVYFNGIDLAAAEGFQNEFSSRRGRYLNNRDYITANREMLKSQIGNTFKTEAGKHELREGLYENSSEVWSRELLKFKDFDFVGIIDPDFEALDGRLFAMARECLERDDDVGYFSSDHDDERVLYNSYTKSNIRRKERYNTWFCIYRRSALENFSSFHYVWKDPDDTMPEPVTWDHSAYLQEVLKAEHGFRGEAMPREDYWRFIHYGAFAKNRDLSGTTLALYRFFRIMKHNGYFHAHRVALLRDILKVSGRAAFKALRLSRYDKQRKQYLFQQTS
jgi:hypothetical protein